ncbi:hypothetical protein KC902_03455 [Candidatus Kaiserbacteria bacterium]|nr:hypothetical protein [Candidatus Kaiserbacteria bacterium]USN88547.1 MAG: hypothetical protein H6780_03610 [Candidatus Nomurabacteria bacterium]
MNEVLHANIFFLIASIATVVFCIFICFILFHVLKIVASLRRIIERIEAGSEAIAQDMAHVRELVAGGGIIARVGRFFMGSTRGRRKSRSYDDE